MLSRWVEFMGLLHRRLEKGEEEYHGESFERPPEELLEELAEEALDLAGWGFVLWANITRNRKKPSPSRLAAIDEAIDRLKAEKEELLSRDAERLWR